MRTHLLLFINLCLLIITPATAQDDESPDYALRVPTAEEYLEAIPDILATGSAKMGVDPDFQSSREALNLAIERELMQSYPDFIYNDFDLVYEVMRMLKFNIQHMFSTLFDENTDGLHYLIFESWLYNNPIDLSTVTELDIETIHIDVSPIDFDGDGNDEYFLTVNDNDIFFAFWIIQTDFSAPTGYSRIKSSTPWFSELCDFRSVCGGGAVILALEDINDDGLTEIALGVGGYCGYGECGGHMSVYAWRNSEIVNINPSFNREGLAWTQPAGGGDSPILPPEGTWSFENVDDDSAIEIVQHWQFTDNRDCEVTNFQIINWVESEQLYLSNGPVFEYSDTVGCMLRWGETAITVFNFEDAIIAYQRAIELMEMQVDDIAEAHQYAQIRLALAYILSDQTEQAITQIRSLRSQSSETQLMADMTSVLSNYIENSTNTLDICRGIYDTLVDFDPYDSDSRIWQFGGTDDGSRSLNYNSYVDPNITGCNLTALRENVISQLDLMVDVSPVPAIVEAGWDIDSQLKLDVNLDGLTDWFIWTTDLNSGFLLITEEGGYDFINYIGSRFNRPTAGIEYVVRPLPNGNTAIMRLDYDLDNPTNDCPDNQLEGALTLWQWTGQGIYGNRRYMLCGERTIEEINPTPDQLRLWYNSNYLTLTTAIEVLYIWDTASAEFHPSLTPDVFPSLDTTSITYEDLYGCGIFGASYCGFYSYYPYIIPAGEFILDNPPPDVSTTFFNAVGYHLALAYEQLNRPDEALAEYIAIYESAPESAWGMLAGLHLEVIND